ncbi:hypothetical protein LMG28727_03099 [Paraburkholderia kirstenboschensis]|nr:hypothetical protein LMG28727_03099 [Paraburkholderia kirstenboschensis]
MTVELFSPSPAPKRALIERTREPVRVTTGVPTAERPYDTTKQRDGIGGKTRRVTTARG